MPFLSHELSEVKWQLFTSCRVLFLDHLSYPYIYIYIKEIIHTQLPAVCSLESFSAGKKGAGAVHNISYS